MTTEIGTSVVKCWWRSDQHFASNC